MSTLRHCVIYKASDQHWYLELADEEYAGREDATTYGPFGSEESVMRELDCHSNPGAYDIDRSGRHAPPTQSPNGNPVCRPSRRRRCSW